MDTLEILKTTRTITIPAVHEHQGLYKITAEVPWNCIYCGAVRGETFDGLSFDGSRRLSVTQWKNPCGHVETYEAVRQWLDFTKSMELEVRSE